MSIGSKIKKVRESRGISQLELAEEIGKTQKAVSAWECDRAVPRMGVLLQIAKYFNVSASSLLDDEVTLYTLIKDIEALSPEKIEKVRSYVKYLQSEV